MAGYDYFGDFIRGLQIGQNVQERDRNRAVQNEQLQMQRERFSSEMGAQKKAGERAETQTALDIYEKSGGTTTSMGEMRSAIGGGAVIEGPQPTEMDASSIAPVVKKFDAIREGTKKRMKSTETPGWKEKAEFESGLRNKEEDAKFGRQTTSYKMKSLDEFLEKAAGLGDDEKLAEADRWLSEMENSPLMERHYSGAKQRLTAIISEVKKRNPSKMRDPHRPGRNGMPNRNVELAQ